MRKKKRQAHPYFKFYVDDFIDGCRGTDMSLEHVGFYTLLLGVQWKLQSPIPEIMVPKHMRLDPRICRRLVEDLVQMGPEKLTRKNGAVFNPRMMEEIGDFKHWQATKQAQQPSYSYQQSQLPLGEAVIVSARNGFRPRSHTPASTRYLQRGGKPSDLLDVLANSSRSSRLIPPEDPAGDSG
jgi:uncharacterized protein YdaU (DUF1376 family)